jgi:hypothetical protein
VSEGKKHKKFKSGSYDDESKEYYVRKEFKKLSMSGAGCFTEYPHIGRDIQRLIFHAERKRKRKKKEQIFRLFSS